MDRVKIKKLIGREIKKNSTLLEPISINLKNNYADLKRIVCYKPYESFLIRVKGDSMINVGISSGDILLVNKSNDAEDGEIVMASVNENIVIKRLHKTNKSGITLLPENPSYEKILINPDDKFEICGVVKSVIKML